MQTKVYCGKYDNWVDVMRTIKSTAHSLDPDLIQSFSPEKKNETELETEEYFTKTKSGRSLKCVVECWLNQINCKQSFKYSIYTVFYGIIFVTEAWAQATKEESLQFYRLLAPKLLCIVYSNDYPNNRFGQHSSARCKLLYEQYGGKFKQKSVKNV